MERMLFFDGNGRCEDDTLPLRILKSMEQHGLVEIRPGKDGGVQLARAPDGITLDRTIALAICTLT